MKLTCFSLVFLVLLLVLGATAANNETFCVSKKCALPAASFEKTALFNAFDQTQIAHRLNIDSKEILNGAEIPLILESGASAEGKTQRETGLFRVLAKSDLKQFDEILSIQTGSMIRDNICQAQYFEDQTTECLELISSLNLTQNGEAFAVGAIYHMSHPENSQ